MLRKKSLKRRGFAPLVIGHRGAMGSAPENTMAAFRKGLSLGADVLECDIHLSRDKRLVIIHDESVDRTTHGSGLVRDLTLQELRLLDAGNRERIPILDDLLEWVGHYPQIGLAIEIKEVSNVNAGIAQAVIDVVRSKNLLGRTTVISFDYATLAEVKDLCPDLATGMIFDHRLEDPIGMAKAIHADIIAPSLKILKSSLVDQAWGAGMAVVTWVANTEAQIQRGLDFAVDGIVSDYPDLVRTAIDHRFAPTRIA